MSITDDANAAMQKFAEEAQARREEILRSDLSDERKESLLAIVSAEQDFHRAITLGQLQAGLTLRDLNE